MYKIMGGPHTLKEGGCINRSFATRFRLGSPIDKLAFVEKSPSVDLLT